MSQEYLFPYGHLEILDTYAIITCNEGVHIDFNEIQDMEAILQSAYHGQRFGLITNRVNQYSVNPLAIKKLFSDECLVAGAIVGSALRTKLNADLENKTVDSAPIGYYPSMSFAIKWISDKVREGSIA